MTLFSRRLLLATDGSEEGELAPWVAVELIPITPFYPEVLYWREDLEWAEREARKVLDEQVKKVEDAGGTVAAVHLIEERPAEEIVALAEELGAYLIVGGSRSHGEIRRALTGSVSDWVVRHAHCPVLVVRSPKSTGGRARSLGPLLARFGASKKASTRR